MKKLLIDEALEESLDLLRKNSTPKGFVASSNNISNYNRIWARDGVIAGLAAVISRDKKLVTTFKKTIETLRKYQDKTGRIPSNVTLDGKEVTYGESVGRVDATLWFAIGNLILLETENIKESEKIKNSIDKILFYLECLEFSGKGLLYIPESGDWADEYINQGYILYDQILYLIFLTKYGEFYKDKKIKKKAEHLKELIRVNYFPIHDSDNPFIYNKGLYEKIKKEYVGPLPITYFTASSYSSQADVFATSLLVQLGITEKTESAKIIDYIKTISGEGRITPAFYPPILEEDYEWKQLSNNHLYEFRNKPFEYHNGGRWPLVNGFFVAASDDITLLKSFAVKLKKDNYIFPEFYHGLSSLPMGTGNLSFSASAYIIAYQDVINKRKIL